MSTTRSKNLQNVWEGENADSERKTRKWTKPYQGTMLTDLRILKEKKSRRNAVLNRQLLATLLKSQEASLKNNAREVKSGLALDDAFFERMCQ